MARHAMPDRLVEVGYQPSPYRSVRYALPEKRARCAMLRMLLSWRASLWKAVWRELAVWLFLYFALPYRLIGLIDREHQRIIGIYQREDFEMSVACRKLIEIGKNIFGGCCPLTLL